MSFSVQPPKFLPPRVVAAMVGALWAALPHGNEVAIEPTETEMA